MKKIKKGLFHMILLCLLLTGQYSVNALEVECELAFPGNCEIGGCNGAYEASDCGLFGCEGEGGAIVLCQRHLPI